MKEISEIIVNHSISIIETMNIINNNALQFVAVVNDMNQLVGTVTDGDIRRGILKGISLNDSISKVMNHKPVYLEESSEDVYQYFIRTNRLKQLPIVNKKNEVIDIILVDNPKDLIVKTNKVVLMVGGLGTRLYPLTEHIPKPMLKVGDKPILENIIEEFKKYGFINFILCVNYKKKVIQDYFQDGNSFGVHIEYVEEKERMGTAGALSLLPSKIEEPFFVMNGDILTNINFRDLMEFHVKKESYGTMCIREYEYQIPFGVIKIDDNKNLLTIEEKPVKKEYVNAGIYVLNPEVIDLIPSDTFYDMPELFKDMLSKQNKATVFPIEEYWMDIGRLDDFEKVNKDCQKWNKKGE